MAHQIIRQPDGKLAVYSSVVGALVVTDATPQEVIDWKVSQVVEHVTDLMQRDLDLVLAGEARKVYYQFTMTWEEAVERSRRAFPELE
jgi:hypothetical protein